MNKLVVDLWILRLGKVTSLYMCGFMYTTWIYVHNVELAQHLCTTLSSGT